MRRPDSRAAFFHGRPLRAEDIASTLVVARSNVINRLCELQNGDLIKQTQVLGDRRDYFETSSDVWELFGTIVRQRREREFAPTVHMLLAPVVSRVRNTLARCAGPRARDAAFHADAVRWPSAKTGLARAQQPAVVRGVKPRPSRRRPRCGH